MDALNYMIDCSTSFLSTGGLFFGFIIVFIECFIPVLPLSLFIALNVNAFGLFLGVFISWLATCTGSFLCYLFFCFLEEKFLKKLLNRKMIQKVRKGMDRFQRITFSQLVLLLTLPFAPSFLINILGGVARVPKEKFLLSLIIGKVFTVTFWGYIGKNLLESLTDIRSILYIFIALCFSYALSKFVNRRMNID